MTYKFFREIVLASKDHTDLDHFIADVGGKDYPEEYTTDRIVEILTAVWGMRENPIKGIKAAAKLTNAKLAEEYGISIRTVEDWARGTMRCPAYTSTMLAYCVFSDKGII